METPVGPGTVRWRDSGTKDARSPAFPFATHATTNAPPWCRPDRHASELRTEGWMSDADRWEAVARMAFWKAFTRLVEETEATADPIADGIYWGHDVDADQVEAMRQAVFDLEYATEEVLARLCEETEPWADDAERTPSWVPAERPEDD